MKHFPKRPFAVAGGALALGGAVLWPGHGILAADHLDPPARTDILVDSTPDRAADIADIFAWHTANSVVLILTFAGPSPTTAPAFYDRDVLYKINISNTDPVTTTNSPITFKFGKGGGANQFGVQVTGLPGVNGPIVGPVETTLVKDGVTVRAGLFDEPFFFDLQGFKETVATGKLSFDNKRNFFAGQNDTAIVIEIPSDRLNNAGHVLNIWGSTARFGGQI